MVSRYTPQIDQSVSRISVRVILSLRNTPAAKEQNNGAVLKVRIPFPTEI
jgi:hypothetical protein